MDDSKRWVLLEHVGDPNDPDGRHFDLLLEDRFECRSWQLRQIPVLDGPVIEASSLASHNLSWLETQGRRVSGGRGWAKPLLAGLFHGSLPISHGDLVVVELASGELAGILEIGQNHCRLSSVSNLIT